MKEVILMVGRPPKDDSRDKQYRVRLNDVEDDMLSFCSKETGEAKSEIFRNALKSYYENAKLFKNVLKDKKSQSEIEYTSEKKCEQKLQCDYNNNYVEDEFEMDHISLRRAITCPYCGTENNMNFADDCNSSYEERQMGPEKEYSFDWQECKCENCEKDFRVFGSIWEYPMGAYNCEDINVEALVDEN
ncbi:hypothetical protein [Clostridium sp. KNHs214]|uniref:hypothetical protein n=1 Tax=Clostridium sp. KNHs214 TaxID=1540257 RepID=UPI00163A6027|nr:hypothetical protein [Clostridium sp. KNHs214]